VRRPRLLAPVLALVVGLGLPACSDGGPGLGEGRLVVQGEAIVRSDGVEERVTDRRDVGAGDEVEMVEGTAALELAGDVTLELRAGRDGGRSSALRMGDVPELLRGDLLVIARGDDPAEIDAAGTVLEVSGGAARLTRALDVQTGLYVGGLVLRSAAREIEVEELVQVAIPARGLVGAPEPLQLDPADAWDRRILGDVIELSRELDVRSDGFSRQAPAAATEPAFYLTRFDALSESEAQVRLALQRGRPRGEQLIGAAITALGERDSAAVRYDRVFAFRADGASWGVVARREGVSRGPLLELIDRVIGDVGEELALSTPTTSGGPPSTAGPPTTAPPTTTAPGGPGTTAPPPTPPPPPPPPEEEGPLPTTGTPIDPVLEPVDDLLGDLLP